MNLPVDLHVLGGDEAKVQEVEVIGEVGAGRTVSTPHDLLAIP